MNPKTEPTEPKADGCPDVFTPRQRRVFAAVRSYCRQREGKATPRGLFHRRPVSLSIRSERPGASEACSLCSEPLERSGDFCLYVAGTSLPVCRSCGNVYAPMLVRLLDMYQAIQRFFAISGTGADGEIPFQRTKDTAAER